MKKVNWIHLIILCETIILSSPLSANDDICESVAREFYYAEDSQVDNEYFEKYIIGKREGVYYIYADKIISTNYFHLLNTFKAVNHYAEFMHGYDAISVKELSESEYLTSIHFVAPLPVLSFIRFESVFTNEVEVQSDLSTYKQCWQQLAKDDERVIEEFNSEPKTNKGYWLLENLGKEEARLSYHSIIQPPVPLPLFVYKYFVKNSYVETYEKIIQRANLTLQNQTGSENIRE